MKVTMPDFDGLEARVINQSGGILTLEYRHPSRGLEICERPIDAVSIATERDEEAAAIIEVYSDPGRHHELGYAHGIKQIAGELLRARGLPVPRSLVGRIVALEGL